MIQEDAKWAADMMRFVSNITETVRLMITYRIVKSDLYDPVKDVNDGWKVLEHQFYSARASLGPQPSNPLPSLSGDQKTLPLDS